MNGFEHAAPDLMRFIQSIHRQCPLLSESILFRSEVETLNDEQDSGDLEASVSIEADDRHLRPAATGCLKVSYVRETLGFPVLQNQMHATFHKALPSSYRLDYGEANLMHFGHVPLQLTKKVSFTHRYVL